jgi:hypothetical protein
VYRFKPAIVRITFACVKIIVSSLSESIVSFWAAHLAMGIQTRIDHWNHEPIELLGDALCVSVEASAR